MTPFIFLIMIVLYIFQLLVIVISTNGTILSISISLIVVLVLWGIYATAILKNKPMNIYLGVAVFGLYLMFNGVLPPPATQTINSTGSSVNIQITDSTTGETYNYSEELFSKE